MCLVNGAIARAASLPTQSVIDINLSYSTAFLVQRIQPASIRVYMSAVRTLAARV